MAQRQNDETQRLTETSLQQNEEVKKISSWAAILFAPTLVGTVYGMNFVHMPELGWRYGYPMAIALMLLMGLGSTWSSNDAGGSRAPRRAADRGAPPGLRQVPFQWSGLGLFEHQLLATVRGSNSALIGVKTATRSVSRVVGGAWLGCMSVESGLLIAAVIAVAMYLLAALIFPERF